MKVAILVFAFVAVAFAQKPEVAFTSEAILIEVKHAERDENGVLEETVLKVGVHVDVREGVVHVNGRMVNHSLVNAIHTKVEIDEYSSTGALLRHANAKIQIRVMVKEGMDAATNAKTLTIEEEVVEVNRKSVIQVDVKQVIVHLNEGKKEMKRIVTSITLKQSRIHQIPRTNDFHCYHRRGHHGRLPYPPFHANRGDMSKWQKRHGVPISHLKPGRLPEHPMRGGHGLLDGDYDEDDDDFEDRHNHHHRHHRFGRKLCKWFHHLPSGVRVVMIIAVVFIGLASVTCCVRCCRSRRARNAYALPAKAATKVELYNDEEIDEAGPLPTKGSLDKVQLIVST